MICAANHVFFLSPVWISVCNLVYIFQFSNWVFRLGFITPIVSYAAVFKWFVISCWYLLYLFLNKGAKKLREKNHRWHNKMEFSYQIQYNCISSNIIRLNELPSREWKNVCAWNANKYNKHDDVVGLIYQSLISESHQSSLQHESKKKKERKHTLKYQINYITLVSQGISLIRYIVCIGLSWIKDVK